MCTFSGSVNRCGGASCSSDVFCSSGSCKFNVCQDYYTDSSSYNYKTGSLSNYNNYGSAGDSVVGLIISIASSVIYCLFCVGCILLCVRRRKRQSGDDSKKDKKKHKAQVVLQASQPNGPFQGQGVLIGSANPGSYALNSS